MEPFPLQEGESAAAPCEGTRVTSTQGFLLNFRQQVSQLAHKTEKNIAPALNVSSLEVWQHYSTTKLVNHQLNKDLPEASLKNVKF